jgi:hypothetical protein
MLLDIITYQRKIKGYVTTLRLFFFAATGLIIFFLFKGIYEYAVFTTILLLPSLIISPVSLTIHHDAIEIKEFTLFGLRQKYYRIDSANVLSMTEYEELLNVDDSAILSADTVFSLAFLIPSASTIKTRQIKLTYLDKSSERTLSLKMTDPEYRLVWTALNRQSTGTNSG